MKIRLDQYITNKYPELSRSKAQAFIMVGKVVSDSKKLDKSGMLVDSESTDIRILGYGEKQYVSRGAQKLLKAKDLWEIDFIGRVVADIGSSTGGFTQVSLEAGAEKVYAIDVGTNQLDYTLRTDDRVVVMEKTNARYLEEDTLQDLIDIVVTDVSFISLKKILPAAYRILAPGAHVVALVKPQFEAGKQTMDACKGILKDTKTQQDILDDMIQWCQENNFQILGNTESPITGGDGNREFLIYLQK